MDLNEQKLFVLETELKKLTPSQKEKLFSAGTESDVFNKFADSCLLIMYSEDLSCMFSPIGDYKYQLFDWLETKGELFKFPNHKTMEFNRKRHQFIFISLSSASSAQSSLDTASRPDNESLTQNKLSSAENQNTDIISTSELIKLAIFKIFILMHLTVLSIDDSSNKTSAWYVDIVDQLLDHHNKIPGRAPLRLYSGKSSGNWSLTLYDPFIPFQI